MTSFFPSVKVIPEYFRATDEAAALDDIEQVLKTRHDYTKKFKARLDEAHSVDLDSADCAAYRIRYDTLEFEGELLESFRNRFTRYFRKKGPRERDLKWLDQKLVSEISVEYGHELTSRGLPEATPQQPAQKSEGPLRSVTASEPLRRCLHYRPSPRQSGPTLPLPSKVPLPPSLASRSPLAIICQLFFDLPSMPLVPFLSLPSH